MHRYAANKSTAWSGLGSVYARLKFTSVSPRRRLRPWSRRSRSRRVPPDRAGTWDIDSAARVGARDEESCRTRALRALTRNPHPADRTSGRPRDHDTHIPLTYTTTQYTPRIWPMADRGPSWSNSAPHASNSAVWSNSTRILLSRPRPHFLDFATGPTSGRLRPSVWPISANLLVTPVGISPIRATLVELSSK